MSISKPQGPIRSAWYRWKAQRWVPWRTRFLVGLDLQGNTFWEFRESVWTRPNRMRRIVQYPSNSHASDVAVSPQWLQWLRHTRPNPPSLTEQSQDLVRQENLKLLAAQADARWAAKRSVLDAPGQVGGQPLPSLRTAPGGETGISEQEINTQNTNPGRVQSPPQRTIPTVGLRESEARNSSRGRVEKNTAIKTEGEKKEDDPWKQARGAQNEQWQPNSWSGNSAGPR